MSELYHSTIECVRINILPFTKVALECIEKHYKCTKYTILNFSLKTHTENNQISLFLFIEINTNKSRDSDIKKIQVAFDSGSKNKFVVYDYRGNIEELLTEELQNTCHNIHLDIHHIFNEVNQLVQPFWSKRFKHPPTEIYTYYRRIKAYRIMSIETYPELKPICKNPTLYFELLERFDGSYAWFIELIGIHKKFGYTKWRVEKNSDLDIITYSITSDELTWGNRDPEPGNTRKICQKLAKIVSWKERLEIFT
jgi:hypothetical protein